MKRIYIALIAFGLSASATAADLTPDDKTWLSSNKIVLPIPFLPNQVTGLHWLLNHDCPPRDITVGNIGMTCKGDKLADVNEYLNLVAVTNFADSNPPCEHPAKYTGPPLIDKPDAQLNQGEQVWLKDHNVKVLPLQMTADQILGLKQLIKSGCRAGRGKVAGIELKCKGDQVADTNNYLDLVSAQNFTETTKCEN